MSNIANGWTFQRGDGGSPEVFTTVPKVSRANPGAPTSPDIDVTHLTSTARETKPGLAQFGEFQAEFIYVAGDATHNAMADEAPSSSTRHYRLMDPTNTFGFEFDLAIATVVPQGFEVDGSIRKLATFKQSGKERRIGAA